MPTIEISYRDLCRLVGTPLPQLQERDILFAKGEVDEVKGDVLKVDIKDTNRPDLWSAEGVAREIRGRLKPEGLRPYGVKPPQETITVTAGRLQPFTAAAIVRGLGLDDAALSQLVQLQEKIALTFGRGRRELSVGVYDLKHVRFPLTYTSRKPDDILFTPLGTSRPMTASDILASHPKGKQYGSLLAGAQRYPVWLDASGTILSMPPIINAEPAGNVTTRTNDIFVECTGNDHAMLGTALNVLVAALADRGGTIEGIEIAYPGRKITTPDLAPRRSRVPLADVARVSGLDLGPQDVVKLLRQAGYQAALKRGWVEVRYPAYRRDIMHRRDIIEDLLISYGYNAIPPLLPSLPAIGSAAPAELLLERVAEVMVGLGLQQVLSYVLTSREQLFARMNAPDGEACEIENPASGNWCIFRTALLPGLLEFLSRNKHAAYPQRVFETGECIFPDRTAETRSRSGHRLAAVVSDAKAGYEDVSPLLAAAMEAFGAQASLKPAAHPSFLPGRTATVAVGGKAVGWIGEVHPQVLNNWGLEKPVAAVEIDLAFLLTPDRHNR